MMEVSSQFHDQATLVIKFFFSRNVKMVPIITELPLSDSWLFPKMKYTFNNFVEDSNLSEGKTCH
jgi:hypothetical protein